MLTGWLRLVQDRLPRSGNLSGMSAGNDKTSKGRGRKLKLKPHKNRSCISDFASNAFLHCPFLWPSSVGTIDSSSRRSCMIRAVPHQHPPAGALRAFRAPDHPHRHQNGLRLLFGNFSSFGASNRCTNTGLGKKELCCRQQGGFVEVW